MPTLIQQRQALHSQLLEVLCKKVDVEVQLRQLRRTANDLRTVLAGMDLAAKADPEAGEAKLADQPTPITK